MTLRYPTSDMALRSNGQRSRSKLQSLYIESVLYLLRNPTGCVKIKCPNTKNIVSQKCVNIFAPNFARLFSIDYNCWRVLLHLVDVRWNDRNLNLNVSLNNEFCNWTNVDFSFQLGGDVSMTSKTIRCYVYDFSQRYPQGITHQKIINLPTSPV